MYQNALNPRKRDTIIDDLLEKYPKGPRGNLQKKHYTHNDEWCNDRKAYITKVIPPVDNFGYTIETIVRLYHAAPDLRTYVQERWDSLKRTGVSRRTNRLQSRISEPYRQWVRTDDRAIYKVDVFDYVPVYVIASSKRTARYIAKTLVIGTGLEGNTEHSSTRKVFLADTDALQVYNKNSQKKIDQRIEITLGKIENLQKDSEKLIALSESVKNYGSVQYDFLTSDED